ncbi:MAG: DUF58 domain-containing protein [Treponema sp.]|nr:DUF58 domain-containing protein [Treponema sp.]
MAEKLLTDRESLIKRAAALRITTTSLASAMQNGAFRSLYHGQGIEFAGVREYLRGDDVRTIDWNVTARSAKPFVKIFEEERELQIFLIVDRSVSMQEGSKSKTRLESATEIAALLTFSAERNSNPVGAVLFSGQIEFAIKPKSSANQTLLLLSRLDEMPDRSKGTALAASLSGAGKLLKKRSLVFVLSDFRAGGWEDSFAHLAARHDVVAVRITDSIDSSLPEIGSVMVRDPERGIRRLFPTMSKTFRSEWREDAAMRSKRWTDSVLRRGGIPLSISTSEDSLSALLTFFSQREIA